ncbi:MAG: hypothetical protein DI626_08315 [Micavibrio aeruginosavorus]|uniref:Uncharacterized protein n=1 Tax=Micavibrio aeruginosavorus TaxID=349221 RepID=A0A2W4ZPS8_9BACT|nr:MAG: hypothetical protein DI626_08315 [Micavibrio aeruginosavorus]
MQDKVSEVVCLLQDYVEASKRGEDTAVIRQKIANEGQHIEPQCEFDGYVKKFSERFQAPRLN